MKTHVGTTSQFQEGIGARGPKRVVLKVHETEVRLAFEVSVRNMLRILDADLKRDRMLCQLILERFPEGKVEYDGHFGAFIYVTTPVELRKAVQREIPNIIREHIGVKP